MNASYKEWISTLRGLPASQLSGVLSTHGRIGPHASLVAFATSKDLRETLFAAPRTTRKFTNLTSSARAAFLVDNRSNTPADFHNATAATASGTEEEILHDDKEALLGPYLARNPHLVHFVRAPTCTLMRLRVERCSVVRRFQEVVDIPVPQGGTLFRFTLFAQRTGP